MKPSTAGRRYKMKTTRTLLIEQAATDNADEGTAWRDRLEAWLKENNQ